MLDRSASAAPGPQVLTADACDVAAQLPPASVACVLTSPPYWGLRTYHLEHNEDVLGSWTAAGGTAEDGPSYDWYRKAGGQLGQEPDPTWYVQHLVEIFGALRPCLTATANVWVNLGDTYFARWSSVRDAGRQGMSAGPRHRRRTPSGGYRHDKQLLMIPARFAIAMQDDGWILRNDVIWSKPNVQPRPERDRLRLTHEHLFHFVQRTRGGRPAYYYDLQAAEPGARDVVSVRTASTHGRIATPTPRALIAPRIATSSPPGGVVLDPFCGGGSVLECAAELGRVAIGADLHPDQARAAWHRLRTLTGTSRRATA